VPTYCATARTPFVILPGPDTDAERPPDGHDSRVLRKWLVACLAVALLVGNPLPAAACSAGPFDVRDYTQLLVLGRARSVELGDLKASGFVEATVTLDVIHVYRGSAPSPLRYVDSGSASALKNPSTGKQEFAGGSGACGTIDDDPVGKFVLIGLARGDDSRWHANRLWGAVYTDEPDYVMYRWIFERHGVAIPFLITGPVTDVGLFGPALAP
jgi:hypothetical protein